MGYCVATSNHAEDVISMFSATLKQRGSAEGGSDSTYLSIPHRVEPEMHGLILAATKKEFCSYMTKKLESGNTSCLTKGGLIKTYRCLVCIKDPLDIDRLEGMVNHTIEHYVDVKSATPKTFVRNKPKNTNKEWAKCLMRITSVGGQSKNFRAACVSSKYSDTNDLSLAHRLWDPKSTHPAEDIGVLYVMQIDVQLMTKCPHQIRGQLAALGVPIVGDAPYGGGVCEMRIHRHMWNRMAVQICHLEIQSPKWAEVATVNEEKKEEPSEVRRKRELVPSEEEKCVFHLNTAWWTQYLVDYEQGELMSKAAP